MATDLRAKALAVVLTVLAAKAANAESVPVPVPPGLKAQLEARYPGTRFGEIHPTPLQGIFEVPMGGRIAYVDATGQYFLFGHLFDMVNQRDLTSERAGRNARIDFAALPLADAILEVRGKGRRTLLVFSDPDCPFCRRLDAELKSVTDITLYTFPMPLEGLHPSARAKAVAAWCSTDRAKAWHAVMRGETPRARDCPNPIGRNAELAQRLGITATPTLVAADGRVLQGAVTRDQLEAWLAKGSASVEGSGSTGTTRAPQ